MDSIAWDIHYTLPNQKYIEYVDHYLLESSGEYVDPFALDVLSGVNEIYTSRGPVEQDIQQPGNKIILGLKGNGGTTLSRMLSNRVPQKTLAVPLFLSENKHQILQRDGQNDRNVPWTLEHLIARIFGAYWNQTIATPSKRGVYLPFLRTNREWMLKLRWFYHHYPPDHYLVLDDFELLAWLNSAFPHETFGPKIKQQDILKELLDFITIALDRKKLFNKTAFNYSYTKVRLIIDHTEGLSEPLVDSLMQGIQTLHALSLPQLEFSIFMNARWEEFVVALPCVESGYVSICKLPRWGAQQLQSLLDNRLMAYRRKEFTDYNRNVINLGMNRSGISEELLNQLTKELSYCEVFNSDDTLRAVFVDARLSPWKDALPEARSPHERFMGTINYLQDKSSDDGNGLVLLLRVLSDGIAHQDSRHQRLIDLATRLEHLKASPSLEHRERITERGPDWVKVLHGLTPTAQHHFSQILIEGALRAYEHSTNFDAPIHLLKLARGLIAACAGCWEERFPLPLGADQLQDIVDLYWEEEKCDG